MPLFGALPDQPSPTTTSWPMPIPPNPPSIPNPIPQTPRTINSFLSQLHTMYRPTRESVSTAPRASVRPLRRSIPALLFPNLGNPFEGIHPAFRRAAARDEGEEDVPSPEPGRFSGLRTNPFSTRRTSQHDVEAGHLDAEREEQDLPFVFDLAEELNNGEEEDPVPSQESSEVSRQWPSEAGRSRRRRTRRRRSSKKTSAPMLFPAMKSHRVRVKMLHTLLSAVIFLLLLITYFALQATNANQDSFQIPFIIFFILCSIALAHSLIRLWLLVRRWNAKFAYRNQGKHIFAPKDKAIPVTMGRDVEVGSVTSERIIVEEELDEEPVKNVALPPPAYGLWRGSVRADPNLLHWQRRHSPARSQTYSAHSEAVPRPPSYTPPMQHSARMDGGYF